MVERKRGGSNNVGSEGGSGRCCPNISLGSHVPRHLQADRETGMNHSAPRGVISTGTMSHHPGHALGLTNGPWEQPALSQKCSHNKQSSQTHQCDSHVQDFCLQDCGPWDEAPGAHMGVVVTAEAMMGGRRLTHCSKKQEWVTGQDLPPPGCVTSGKPPNLSEPVLV